MALDTISTGRPRLAISGSSGRAHDRLRLGGWHHQTNPWRPLVVNPVASSSGGATSLPAQALKAMPPTAAKLHSDLDDLRRILAETGFYERPTYVAENEERDRAILAEFAPVRGRVNRRVLR